MRYLVLEQLSACKPAPLEWLWPGKIPLVRLTLIAGDPRVGESSAVLDMAARVSRGAARPDVPGSDEHGQPQQAGNVIILGMSNASLANVVSRLSRAGGDLARVFFAGGVYQPVDSPPEQGWRRPICLADDLISLAKTIRELSPVRLVILDALWAFTGKTRARSQGALASRLAEIAEDCVCVQKHGKDENAWNWSLGARLDITIESRLIVRTCETTEHLPENPQKMLDEADRSSPALLHYPPEPRP